MTDTPPLTMDPRKVWLYHLNAHAINSELPLEEAAACGCFVGPIDGEVPHA